MIVEQARTDLLRSLLAMDRVACQRLVNEVLEDTGAEGTISTLLVPTLEEIGTRWESGDLGLSQVYMAGRIGEELIDTVLPPADAGPPRRSERLALAVLNDYHLLGKRIVRSMLRSAGFEPMDWGTVNVDGLVSQVAAHRPDALLLSVLMLPSALQVRQLKNQLADRGISVPPIIVGGAPFRIDPELAAEVGADAYGTTASDAVSLVDAVLKGGK